MKKFQYLNFKLVAVILFSATVSWAHIGPEFKNGKPQASGQSLNLRAICTPGIAEIDQEINNVRARLSTGGDVWWNRADGLYIVPKPAPGQRPVSALFAGGVWVGGIDRAGNYKLAGVTYRSLTANFDWYPGPLDGVGKTEKALCASWDRFFIVSAFNINTHIFAFERARSEQRPYDCDSIPASVKYWPGRGNPYWRERYNFALPDQTLGAFWDENEDGIYDPCDGDFPNIEIRDCGPENRTKAKELVPDEMHFWIYNDNGGPHRLTAGGAIQMEVQVQAFAYATNDEVNDMTFQRYKLINKANEDLVDCYFAMWVDPDLGCSTDDYIGCDVGRSLAYTYNEDAVDGENGANCPGGVNTYGSKVPIIATDYFRGPRGPKVFVRNPTTGVILKDANGNPVLRDPTPRTGEVDTLVELGMTSFMYSNRSGAGSPAPQTTDPAQNDLQFYNIMRGLWKGGEPVTFGASGFNPGSSDTVKYVFPGNPNNPTAWSMCTAGLPNGDRRTIQATGPLLLQPGATNELIIGVVFVPDLDYPCPDISRLQSADDIAQALFNNCFDITDGPDAPDLYGIELDRELILAMSNDAKTSNNPFGSYIEVDLKAPETVVDKFYRFEGYKVFQLKDAGVSPQELSEISKARLIYQTDTKNGMSEIFNWASQPNPLASNQGEPVWSYTRMVQGADAGISNTLSVIEDQFAVGGRKLINNKPYHFMVLAYAYNNFGDFKPKEVVGQRTPYLEGRRNVKVYSFTPRPIVYTNLKAEYGDGAIITRISGQGSGGNFLDLQDGIAENIVKGTFDGKIIYKNGAGPLDVKIFNPFEITNSKYRLALTGTTNNSQATCNIATGARWNLTDLATNEVIASETTIERINEQIIFKKGFSVTIGQVDEPGVDLKGTNGAVGQTLTYKETGKRWFNASIPGRNRPVFTPGAFIPASAFEGLEPKSLLDPNGRLKVIGSGHFFPFAIARTAAPTIDEFPVYLSPAVRDQNIQAQLLNTRLGNLALKDLNNVDIVFTPNKELWSRCIVVETSSPDYYNAAGAATIGRSKQLDIRDQVSVDKEGKPQPTEPIGLGWFPGYAVDVETGERLNIFFGENSSFSGNNARFLQTPGIASDMIFNPSAQLVAGVPGALPLQLVFGGQHNIYVTRQKYDACAELRSVLTPGVSSIRKIDPLSLITWVCMAVGDVANPMLSVADGLIPNELKIKLRVNNAFNRTRVIDRIANIKTCTTVPALPVYEFEFSGKAAEELKQEEYAGALANVKVVPNPYYAYSAYETSQFTNTIKVTNLPERAIVTIYSIDGKFIRKFNRDERSSRNAGNNPAVGSRQIIPSLEWDMKNAVGIPVASGVYLVHISAPELGEERTIKWFGVNRKFDPTGL